MSFFQVFASYCSLFSGRAYGFCFFLDGFFSSATLRTVWGYEILIFIFKSEPVSKNETINKSLWSLTVGEVSSEVNSNSTHLPVVAVWATQGHNCFWALWMQTHACVHTDKRAASHTNTTEASDCCFSQCIHEAGMYSFKTALSECNGAGTESICHSFASSGKFSLFSNH